MKRKRGALVMGLQLTFAIGPANGTFGESKRRKLFKQLAKNVFFCSGNHFSPSPAFQVWDVTLKRLT